MSHAHRGEWLALMDGLLTATAASRVSSLSGKIHLGAHGLARRDRASVEQFIASGIVHPPPPRALARLIERFAARKRRRADIDIDSQAITPEGQRYLAERNWLEVAAHPDGGLDAVLHAERSGPLMLITVNRERRPN